MNSLFLTLSIAMLGCSTPEERSENMFDNLSKEQAPCSILQEGQRVPSNVQLGACSVGKTIHLTLHRECSDGRNIHNNPFGWWTDDAIFHKGEPSQEMVVNCKWK